jgi:hypothetical protein
MLSQVLLPDFCAHEPSAVSTICAQRPSRATMKCELVRSEPELRACHEMVPS